MREIKCNSKFAFELKFETSGLLVILLGKQCLIMFQTGDSALKTPAVVVTGPLNSDNSTRMTGGLTAGFSLSTGIRLLVS